MPVPGAIGHTKAPQQFTRTAANAAWSALTASYALRPQQRLRVEPAQLAVRVNELEQIPADGTHRHNVDQWFGDYGPILSLLAPASGILT
jgi:hypothetical protein